MCGRVLSGIRAWDQSVFLYLNLNMVTQTARPPRLVVRHTYYFLLKIWKSMCKKFRVPDIKLTKILHFPSFLFLSLFSELVFFSFLFLPFFPVLVFIFLSLSLSFFYIRVGLLCCNLAALLNFPDSEVFSSNPTTSSNQQVLGNK